MRLLGKIFIVVAVLALVLVPLAACGEPQEPTGPAGGTPVPLPEQVIDTIDAAWIRVDAYLHNLATTPEAKAFLAEYIDNRWHPTECISILGSPPGGDGSRIIQVFTEQDYEGWDVEGYIVQHIFDSEFEPGTEMLQQVLRSGTCYYGCGPTGETTYPVTWFVDRQSGLVMPYDGNALRVEAKLLE
jgi:hypothetical protein